MTDIDLFSPTPTVPNRRMRVDMALTCAGAAASKILIIDRNKRPTAENVEVAHRHL